MTEDDVNPPINNDAMEKRNEFIDHPSYMSLIITERNIKLEPVFIKHYPLPPQTYASPWHKPRKHMYAPIDNVSLMWMWYLNAKKKKKNRRNLFSS